jgi:hypothetical protein
MVKLAWVLLVAVVVLAPLSLFTFAKDEPPAVLLLSWAALAYTAIDQIMTAKANKKMEQD